MNSALDLFNLRIGTRTAERAEAKRLSSLVDAGHFEKPVFPILRQFAECDPDTILNAFRTYRGELRRFAVAKRDGYRFRNDYFTSPDAEVAYAIVRLFRPQRIIEIGSGHSTKLFREAIQDAGLIARLVSIDPVPRADIRAVADEVVPERLERVPSSRFQELSANDILFIDSSHEISIGNDVVNLALRIVPELRAGVLIHFHDIFLPFDYPKAWIVNNEWTWNEQYLVQALLQGSTEFHVLWPGHYFQRTRPDLTEIFDYPYVKTGSSLWLRKIA
jgi:hypothetical protein